MVHLDLHHTDRLSSLLDHRTDLGEEVDGRRLSFGEDVDVVGGHSLLSDQHLLGSVDDEVTSLKTSNSVDQHRGKVDRGRGKKGDGRRT